MTDLQMQLGEAIAKVTEVLNRSARLDALLSLLNAVQFSLPSAPLDGTVIAIDSGVILRLSNHNRGVDVIDFLRTDFGGRLILPGQVVQEFWNNQFGVVPTKAKEIKRKFDELKAIVEPIDSRFSSFSARFDSVVNEFDRDFGYVFDDRVVSNTKFLFELLYEKAIVPFAPRTMLADTALARKRTKTPPGFKDDLDGDFYVWADLLLGLVQLSREMGNIDRVAFVTADSKLDWSRGGVPHPILSSEVTAICGATFEVLSIDGLVKRLLEPQ